MKTLFDAPNTLTAICGPRDPEFPAPAGRARRAGPLLRLLDERPYDRVHLLGDPFRAEACAAALRERWPALSVRVEADGEAAAEDQLARLLHQTTGQQVYVPPEAPEAYWRVAENLAQARIDAVLVVVELFDADPSAVEIRNWKLMAPEVVREPSYGSAAPRVVRLNPQTPEAPPDPARVGRELGLVGEDPRFLQALHACGVLAGHPVPVLIRGETGTGKELFARLLHRLGPRREGPFVAVNCGALPATLIESILFGHRKGAFTGATQDQPGKFMQADGGTLFLDEIGELPPDVQPKLLRVLQDGVVEAVGAAEGRKVNLRVVAATHRDLRAMAAEGRFREDLFYRLAFGLVELPALRERAADLPALATHLLSRLNRGFARPKRLAASAVTRLHAHPWPGNIRELEGVLARSALWCEADTLEAGDIRLEPPPAPAQAALPEPHEGFSLETFLAQSRERIIRRALDLAAGNQSAAARLLGVSPQAIHKFVNAPARG